MYRSSGTSSSPIEIYSNLIVGGGPSESGGGIMLGDDGGAYITARRNVLVDPGQYGIAVSGGNHMQVSDNWVYGRRQPFTNVGIYVWNQHSSSCNNITVSGNGVKWTNSSGRSNPFWDGGNCGTIAGVSTNDFNAPIGPSIEYLPAPECACKLAGRVTLPPAGPYTNWKPQWLWNRQQHP
jgi:hypothetical protein